MKEKGKFYYSREYVTGAFGGEYKLVVCCTETTDQVSFKGVVMKNEMEINPKYKEGDYSESWNSQKFTLCNDLCIQQQIDYAIRVYREKVNDIDLFYHGTQDTDQSKVSYQKRRKHHVVLKEVYEDFIADLQKFSEQLKP